MASNRSPPSTAADRAPAETPPARRGYGRRPSGVSTKGPTGTIGRRPHLPPPGEASAAPGTNDSANFPRKPATQNTTNNEVKVHRVPNRRTVKLQNVPQGLPRQRPHNQPQDGAAPPQTARPDRRTAHTKSSKPSYTTSKHEPGRQTGRATSTARQGVNTSLSLAGANAPPQAAGGPSARGETRLVHAGRILLQGESAPRPLELPILF